VDVTTNFLESLVVQHEPSRAELNDVVSTLLIGTDGLVVAAETAIGNHPVGEVNMIRTLMKECEKWTKNTALSAILKY
jgi:pyruvate kinase